MTFNAKNLNYDMKEPSFLRKLKGEYGAGDSHRHERPTARPRKQQTGEDDDGPTYVDEESNETISKSQYDALVGKPATDVSENEVKAGPETIESPHVRKAENGTAGELKSATLGRNVVEIGNRRKRKAAKVIIEDAGDSSTQAKATSTREPNETSKSMDKRTSKRRTGGSVKLSFDD
ncbi:MAG: hypothetical protein M1836_003818 [Candelina mexicana]|nr:MAG: hypothetical protein M1836_003818 [Candelina mexicana]